MENGRHPGDIFIDMPKAIPNLESIPGFTGEQVQVLNAARGLIDRYTTEPFEAVEGVENIRCVYVPQHLDWTHKTLSQESLPVTWLTCA